MTDLEAAAEMLSIEREIAEVERELLGEIAGLTQRATALLAQWADARREAFRDRCTPGLPLQ